MPSTAADIIPPAYPAPSPHGYNPFMFDCLFSFLVICTGDELLVSTPVIMFYPNFLLSFPPV